MMKKTILSFVLATAMVAQAQRDPSGFPAKDREVTDGQALEIFGALRAVSGEAKQVVFPIYAGRARVAYGISIGKSRLLTKASEVIQRPLLFTSQNGGDALGTQIIGLYPEQDLAVLEVKGLQAPAAQWADAGDLAEGAFLTAIRSDGEAQAMGVLSVRERSLRAQDQGFLGIAMDPREMGRGVRVGSVVAGSAAAAVGIRAGDRVIRIDGEEVTGFYELSTKLRRLKNGQEPTIELLRGEELLEVKPKLKGREIEKGTSWRLNRMDRMSGGQSRVRGNFGNVIQSDMQLEVNDAGLPVVDLQGRIVGMVIARAGRISTLILPGDDIAATLAEEPEPFVAPPPVARRPPLRWNDRRARMQRELEAMRRMMENLQRELERE